MIRKNIKDNSPFLLDPVGKDYIWGGEKLKKCFNKDHIDKSPLAETWECSTHPDGLSKIRSTGESFASFLRRKPGLLCKRESLGEFPLLLKLIDAKENLSVQVHPDDDYARVNENGQKGKTELWYIIDAEKDSYIYLGFKSLCNKEKICELIETGNLETILNKVPVRKGDSFLVKPGTVHAIGKGILLAEIQENSNITYRLYDYSRTDSLGNKRELHLKKALEVLDMTSSFIPGKQKRHIKYEACVRKELLVFCKYFIAEIWSVKGKTALPDSLRKNSIVLCIDGVGEVSGINDIFFEIRKGDCFFIPYSDHRFFLSGNPILIVVRF